MWLLVRSGPEAGAAVLVTGESFVVGRQRGCDLIVRDARASRRHAELSPVDGGLRLRDLGSSLGTVVDGSLVDEAFLRGGEELRIGDTLIEVWRQTPPEVEARDGRAEEEEEEEEEAGSDVPTYSGVRRLVETATRRARRTAVVATGFAVLAVTGAAILLVTLLAGGGAGERVPEVVARLTPSTVLVAVERAGARTSTGSGWVLDADAGLVVTNFHVINEGDTATVIAGGRARRTRVIAAAPCEDLVVLRVGDRSGLRSASLGDGKGVKPGETVVALGFGADADLDDTVGSTTGVVSVPRTTLRDPAPDVPAYPDVIQTDTALNPGASGGPLADLSGRLIGVNSAARTASADGRTVQNVNYAIAIDRARRVLEVLRTGRGVGWTGLTFGYPTDASLRAERLPPGIRVTGAVAGTPGARALRDLPVGALIAGVDGRPIRSTLQSFCGVAGDRRAGEPLRLDVAQPGSAHTRQVVLRTG
jgi:S1-C subfamily serine protease